MNTNIASRRHREHHHLLTELIPTFRHVSAVIGG